jgi:hypothetical protein
LSKKKTRCELSGQLGMNRNGIALLISDNHVTSHSLFFSV